MAGCALVRGRSGIVVLLFGLVCAWLLAVRAGAEGGGDASSGAGRFSCVFISDARVERLKEALAAGREPVSSAFEALRRHADANLLRRPMAPKEWYVPGYYRDAEGHRRAKDGLRQDANAAYGLALCFRMTGDRRYAESAVRLINAWASGLETMSRRADSMLSFSYHFPALIFAADLIRDEGVWDEDEQAGFEGFLRDRTLVMNTMGRKNNWGNWGLVLAVSCAVYLKDEALFEECEERWKGFIDDQIAEEGVLRYEVNRSGGERGIWYSHFCLMPQTIAAEILAVNGADLFDYRSPEGRTLEQAFRRVAGWTDRPESFPYWQGEAKELKDVEYFSYFEILNARWPNEAASRLLEQSRPVTADHSSPFLTFTHGEVLPAAAGE